MSNEQQIATAKEEHEKTTHTLAVTRRNLEEAEAKLLNKSKRVEEKLRRFRQQKRITPLEQFLDFDWADKPFFTPVSTLAEGQGPIPAYLETSGKVCK
jgi:putative heme iron utilization protein